MDKLIDEQFAFQTEESKDSMVIAVTGRIDGVNAQKFYDNLNREIQDLDNNLILDFEKLSYINSAGLSSILLAAKALQKKNKRFMLCSLPSSVMQVVKISGFDKIIDIYESRSTALSEITS